MEKNTIIFVCASPAKETFQNISLYVVRAKQAYIFS